MKVHYESAPDVIRNTQIERFYGREFFRLTVVDSRNPETLPTEGGEFDYVVLREHGAVVNPAHVMSGDIWFYVPNYADMVFCVRRNIENAEKQK